MIFFNLLLFLLHIISIKRNETNCINCRKKKRFICNSSISHLSVYYIKYWLQNNSISLFP